MNFEDILYDLVMRNKQKNSEQKLQYQQLFLEDIRPEDLPSRDWPRPEPNKRVIIIDI